MICKNLVAFEKKSRIVVATSSEIRPARTPSKPADLLSMCVYLGQQGHRPIPFQCITCVHRPLDSVVINIAEVVSNK